jgi:hypothetical protein
MSNGLGYMIGPIIGSIFYKFFGYVGPFVATGNFNSSIFLGIIQMLIIPLQIYTLPEEKDSKERLEE